VRIPWFQQHAHYFAVVDHSYDCGYIGNAGEQQARNMWPSQADGAQKLGTIHARHRVVADDDTDGIGVLVEQAQTFIRACRGHRCDTHLSQDAGDCGSYGWLVIDH